ncbi:hypothetical protein GCM10027589_22040 [Actinocorallia lasiicapitis]
MATPLQASDPRQLGAYWLASRLGAGGQGVVYEGYDAQGTRVAVKALHNELVTDDFRHALRKEVETLNQVASFCTARIIATDLDHLPPYIVSEYVPGPDLQTWVERNGAYTSDELYRLAIGIATALSSIHRAGVVHRDMKPANVLLGPDGPRVIDFGIAKTEEMSRSATGNLKGTPRWMAPELFLGQRATPAVNVWAWGAIVLFCATGRPPFDGESLPSLMHQVLNTEPETHFLSEPLRGFVERALSHEPANRPSPQEILVGLIGGEARDPLEAGKDAAASLQPSAALPPSLAELAEGVYRQLDPHAQEAVPRVLLRMVAARPDAADTLRNVAIGEFSGDEVESRTVQRILNSLGEAGLLHSDGHTIGIGTPALIRAWPRMRDWVASERDGLTLHHSLADAARFWDSHGRKPGDLYQGSTLDQALTWAATGRRQLTLNLVERAFLDASVTKTRTTARNRRLTLATVSAALVLALVAGAAAGIQSLNLSRTNTKVATQRDTATGAQLAAKAVALRRIDPHLARRLAIAGVSLAPESMDARSAVTTLYHQWEQFIFVPPGVDNGWSVDSDQTGHLLVFLQNRTVKIVDADARSIVREFEVEGDKPIIQYDLSDDGRVLAVNNGGITRFFDVGTGQQTGAIQMELSKLGAPLELSPKGTYLTLHAGRNFVVWEVAGGKMLIDSRDEYRQIAISPNENLVIAAYEDKVTWWSIKERKKIKGPKLALVKRGSNIDALTVSPDSAYLGLHAGNELQIYDTKKFLGRAFGAPDGDSADVRFSSDSKYVAYDHTLWSTEGFDRDPLLVYKRDLCGLQRFGPDDKSLRCVDTDDAVNSIDVSAFTRPLQLTKLGFSPSSALSKDGTTLAVDNEGGIDIWDPVTKQKRNTLPIGPDSASSSLLYGYWLSPDGRTLANGHENGTIDLWDVPTATKRITIQTGAPFSGKPIAGISPDGKVLAVSWSRSGGPTLLQLWDTATGKLLKENSGQVAASFSFGSNSVLFRQVVFSADGRSVFAGDDQGLVEVPSGKVLIGPERGVNGEATSKDGTTAWLYGVRIYFLDREFRRIGPGIRAGVSVVDKRAAFSPDGRLLATTDPKGHVLLWDVKEQRPYGIPLTGHLGADPGFDLHSLGFTPDGSSVISLGEDGLLVTHLIDPKKIREELCRTDGALTEQEWKQHVPDVPYRATC